MTRSVPAVLAFLVAAGPLGAQVDLRDLPTADRQLRVGDTLTGALSAADPTLPDGGHARAWRLGTPGLSVTVDLRSDDFDAFLYLIGPNGTVSTDDDGGGGCHARISHRIPPGEEYRVVVTTLSPDETGRFTLAVSDDPGPLDPASCAPGGMPDAVLAFLRTRPSVGPVRPGDEIQAALSADDPAAGGDGPYVHIRDLIVPAGQEITVELFSEAFDAFVIVIGPDRTAPLMDDDCAGGTNASLAFTTAADSGYRVVATSFRPEETGAYTLVVSRGVSHRSEACRAREDDG